MVVALGERRNESIPRQPPHHGIEPADLLDTARARMYAVWEGRDAEIVAVRWFYV